MVTLHGLVDGHNSRQLGYILWDLIDQQGNRNLVIDLRDATVGEGADLGVFVTASHATRRQGGRLRISGASDDASKALRQAGLNDSLTNPRDADAGKHPSEAPAETNGSAHRQLLERRRPAR